jgi:hypothetical protein
LILKEEDYNLTIIPTEGGATKVEFYPHIHRLFFPQIRGAGTPRTAAGSAELPRWPPHGYPQRNAPRNHVSFADVKFANTAAYMDGLSAAKVAAPKF